jgi:hypothetical protein
LRAPPSADAGAPTRPEIALIRRHAPAVRLPAASRGIAFALLAALLACIVLALPAAAQAPKLRPGLWEHGYTIAGERGGQMAAAMKAMQQQLASMPPAQRKQMEDMMAKQGIGLGAAGNTVKVCLTREDAERDEPPKQEGCTQTVRRSGSTWDVSFQCKGPPPSSGKGRMTLASPTAYAGEFDITTEVDGKPERMKMTQNGRWLAADCGTVRPAPR